MKKYIEKFQKQTNFSTQILIVIGIILVVNFLSYQIFHRFDLTENNIYSISKVSKRVVKDLDDLVNIKVYFSKNLPNEYASIRQEVEDILNEYQNYANNKIKVEFIDPKDNEELQQELQMMEIPQLQFNIVKNDQFQVINGYLGMVISFGDKKQAIPVVNDVTNLEYQLTTAIKKVTSEKVTTIAFATGHEELTTTSELTMVKRKLEEVYEVQDVDLTSGNKIADEIDTLIIAGPKTSFNERERFIIDQFIMSGRGVVFLVEGVSINDDLAAEVNNTNLNQLLRSYGLEVENKFVLDVSNDKASFTQGFLTFSAPYPFFVKVTESGFEPTQPAVAKLQILIMPWASPIKINDSENIISLARTTSDAWVMPEPFSLNPQGNFNFYEDPETYNLVVTRFNKLSSAFNKYIPQTDEEGEHLVNTENARLAVIGDADFTSDRFVGRYPDNALFFQNIVDTVTLDSDLISIRSKEISARPLKELEAGTKKAIKYFNIFGVTILVLALGLGRYYLRRKKNSFIDEL